MNFILNHIAIFVCLFGLAIFAFCSGVGKYPDLKRIGEIMFGVGLFWSIAEK